jgi:hypothetical protein
MLVDGRWPLWSDYLPHVVLAVAALALGRAIFIASLARCPTTWERAGAESAASATSELRVTKEPAGKQYKVYRHPGSACSMVEPWHTSAITRRCSATELRGAGGRVARHRGHERCGKSTLLKILSGTTLPSEEAGGERSRCGAAAARPGCASEFDGWQNAILACQLMGITTAISSGA